MASSDAEGRMGFVSSISTPDSVAPMGDTPVRLSQLIEPGNRVLFAGAPPPESELPALQERARVLETLSGASAARPGRGDLSRFDVAVVSAPQGDDRSLQALMQSVLPLLEPDAYLLLIVDATAAGREVLDTEVPRAGLVVAYLEPMDGPDRAPALVAMAFPLPAIGATVLRERVHRLVRRAVRAEYETRRLERLVRQFEDRIAADDGHAVTPAAEPPERREPVMAREPIVSREPAATPHVIVRAEPPAAPRHADAAEVRTPEHPAADAQPHQEAIAQLRADLEQARADVAASEAARADAAAQMQVLRESFSWRLTTPLRLLAGLLGRTTTDRALGWRK